MRTLLQDPLPMIYIGIFVEAMLAVVYVNTRRRLAIWAMVGVLILVAAGVGLERLIVTETEEVKYTLDGIAAALEANDLDRLLDGYIAESAHETRTRARYAHQMVEITSANVHNLKIVVNHLANPLKAKAQFDGNVYYFFRSPQFGGRRYLYAAKFVAEFVKEGDRWVVTNHVEYAQQSL